MSNERYSAGACSSGESRAPVSPIFLINTSPYLDGQVFQCEDGWVDGSDTSWSASYDQSPNEYIPISGELFGASNTALVGPVGSDSYHTVNRTVYHQISPRDENQASVDSAHNTSHTNSRRAYPRITCSSRSFAETHNHELLPGLSNGGHGEDQALSQTVGYPGASSYQLDPPWPVVNTRLATQEEIGLVEGCDTFGSQERLSGQSPGSIDLSFHAAPYPAPSPTTSERGTFRWRMSYDRGDSETHSNVDPACGYSNRTVSGPAGNDLLKVPSDHWSASVVSSPQATTPALDVRQCIDCNTEFTGEYANGNLARHRRLKHQGGNTRAYPCADDDCASVFQRQDSRLKHYRRHHPHLAGGEAVPRGSQRSRYHDGS